MYRKTNDGVQKTETDTLSRHASSILSPMLVDWVHRHRLRKAAAASVIPPLPRVAESLSRIAGFDLCGEAGNAIARTVQAFQAELREALKPHTRARYLYDKI